MNKDLSNFYLGLLLSFMLSIVVITQSLFATPFDSISMSLLMLVNGMNIGMAISEYVQYYENERLY